MPASPEEIEGALEEGNILEELVSPGHAWSDERRCGDRAGSARATSSASRGQMAGAGQWLF
jgi:hypothetical protein